MPSNYSTNLSYFDIYSKRITFFYNNKEKIGSYFGFSITLTYIFTSLILFIYYFIRTIKRNHKNVYESKIYSENIPSLEVNHNLINFAFGIEDKKTSMRFIDEEIYYPQILYIQRAKIDGIFKTLSIEELTYERCNENSFGEEYQKFFYEGELNNSYCLKDFNLTLAGGYKYDIMNYIRIKIFPCINGTNNRYNCKPREIVDQYISGSYLSFIIKDIGLNPTNYSYPGTPTIQNIYTTLDKKFFRDFILSFGLSEVHSDIGFFNEIISKKRYLRYRKQESTIYFRDKEYENDKEICAIQIRLDDNIEIQKRTYTKLAEIFSLIGGYMQLLHTIFSIMSIIVNKIGPEIKILNDIFNFNVKTGKMIMKINSLKNPSLIMLSRKSKGKIIPDKIIHGLKKLNEDKTIISKKSEKELFNNDSLFPITIINKNEDLLSPKPKRHKQNDNLKKLSFIKNSKYNEKGQNFSSIYFNKISNEERESERNEYKAKINFNLFEYYCFWKLTSKKKEINLFHKSSSLYRKKMDIINIFTLLILTEKNLINKENKNILRKELEYANSPK